MRLIANTALRDLLGKLWTGLPQGQGELPQMELKNPDRPGWAQMTTGLPMDRRPDPQLPQDFGSALEALDNRSPVEAVPCTNWELYALTGAAEGFSRASLGPQQELG
jgi:hypothetical protein